MIAEVTPLKADPTIVDEIVITDIGDGYNGAHIERLADGLYWMGVGNDDFYIRTRNGKAVIQTAVEYNKADLKKERQDT